METTIFRLDDRRLAKFNVSKRLKSSYHSPKLLLSITQKPTRMSIYICNAPVILFRVIHDGAPNLYPTSSFDQRGSLLPRDLSRPLTIEAIDDHLSWAHRATPLLSFCTWPTAVGWMRFLIESRGAINVRIIAIDSSRLHNFIDGYAVAEALGYRSDGYGDGRRQLAYHLGEYILHGWVQGELGERCQILAILSFSGWPFRMPRYGTGLRWTSWFMPLLMMGILSKKTSLGRLGKIRGTMILRNCNGWFLQWVKPQYRVELLWICLADRSWLPYYELNSKSSRYCSNLYLPPVSGSFSSILRTDSIKVFKGKKSIWKGKNLGFVIPRRAPKNSREERKAEK